MFSIHTKEWERRWHIELDQVRRTKHLFTIISPLFSNSYMLSNNSNILLYLNSLNLCIKNLYMFWNIRNLISWRDAGNKRSSCSDDSKYCAFISGQLEQQFKMQRLFWIFDTVIGDGQLYDDAASQALKCMCGLFRKIWFLY